MKKLIVITAALIAFLTSCNLHHTCPAYIGSTGPHAAHSLHHPHH